MSQEAPLSIQEANSAFLAAAREGNADALARLSRASGLHARAADRAIILTATYGHYLATVWCMKSAGMSACNRALSIAAARGDLAITWALLEHIPPGFMTPSVLSDAAKSGKLEVLELVYGRGDHRRHVTSALCMAARTGHRHIAEWCLDRGAEYVNLACIEALKHEQLDMAEWLLGRCPDPLLVMNWAAYHANLIALTVCVRVVAPGSSTLAQAARSGNSQCYQWVASRL